MIQTRIKLLALMAVFGSLAIVLSFIYFSLPPWGDITPASTPVSIVATIAPFPVGMGASVIKGIGISMWTGEWFMEIPVGVGDSLMAAFTYFLIKRKLKPSRAVVLGQLSRFLFTSGMVALYVSSVVSLGVPSPLGGDVAAQFDSYAARLGLKTAGYPFLSCMAIVWLARVPSMTLSILLNSLLSVAVVVSAEKQLKALAQRLH
jgi:thiamine transporter ThiT